VTEILSPGSREGELGVPIIELPDGKTWMSHSFWWCYSRLPPSWPRHYV
jgi:hypothetical protein